MQHEFMKMRDELELRKSVMNASQKDLSDSKSNTNMHNGLGNNSNVSNNLNPNMLANSNNRSKEALSPVQITKSTDIKTYFNSKLNSNENNDGMSDKYSTGKYKGHPNNHSQNHQNNQNVINPNSSVKSN